MILKLLKLIILLFVVFKMDAQTNIPININTNLILTPNNNPYVLQANTTISPNTLLQINPGVIINNSGSFILTINGTLQANGKSDSMIYLNNIGLVFNTSASNYILSSNSGCKLNYTKFINQSNIQTAIKNNGTSIFIGNCSFTNYMYNFYGNYNDTCELTVNNCKINCKTSGYAVYGFEKNSKLNFSNDTFINHGYFYMGEKNNIKNNIFLKGESGYYGLYSSLNLKIANIECNHFSKLNYAINMPYSPDSLQSINILNNYFDNCQYAMYFFGSKDHISKIKINNNNFINTLYYHIYSSFAVSTGVQLLDCTNNYWGSNDTNLIKSKIYDNIDNSSNKARVDYSNYQSNITGGNCWPAYFNPTSSINTFNLEFVNAFPNPTNNFINIEFKNGSHENYKVSVLNNIGVELMNLDLNDIKSKIDISHLSTGIYFLKILNQKNIIYLNKIIKN